MKMQNASVAVSAPQCAGTIVIHSMADTYLTVPNVPVALLVAQIALQAL